MVAKGAGLWMADTPLGHLGWPEYMGPKFIVAISLLCMIL